MTDSSSGPGAGDRPSSGWRHDEADVPASGGASAPEPPAGGATPPPEARDRVTVPDAGGAVGHAAPTEPVDHVPPAPPRDLPPPTSPVRPASPLPPPSVWGEHDHGPGSPAGSVRPPDTIGTVETPPGGRARRPFAAGMLGALVGAVLGTAGTLAVVRTTPAFSPSAPVSAPTSGPSVSAPVVEGGVDGGSVVTAVAAAVTPSVVRIDVLTEETDPTSGEIIDVPAGVGSGVIYRSDGYILTNNHVVEGANTVRVRLSDGASLAAEVVGTDPLSDLAVLRVERTGLPAINLREDTPEVGETAIAIGTPFGLDASVTAGVVSAVNRDLQVPPQAGRGGLVIPAVLQTDAAINPGNSGGALVDANGRLIGINTAILTRTGGSQGVGFAISTRSAVSAAEQMIAKGFVSHPFLGIGGLDVSREIARAYQEEYGIELSGGAVVDSVSDDSGAGRAGVEPGDIIVELEGETIVDMTDLIVTVRQYAPGDTITLSVLRDGERLDLEVTLGERTR